MDDLVAYLRGHSRPISPIPADLEPRLPRLPGIRAVAFDIYGTLFVSGAGEMTGPPDAAEEAAFVSLGLAPATLANYRRIVRDHWQRRHDEGIAHPEVEIREVWRELLALAARPPAGPGLPDRLCLAYECAVHPVWPMPGAVECLEALRGRGLALGIVSNAQFCTPLLFPALLGRDLADFGFAEDGVILSHRLREAKPSLRLYEILARHFGRLGLSPAETLYVGNDLRNDIQPAAAVGFRTALYAGDARSLRLRRDDPALAHVEPDWVVTDLRQIPESIG